MKVHHGIDDIGLVKDPVVTTGTFDGIHLGHQAIIRRLCKLACDTGGESVLITFHPHPRRVLYPDTKGRDLMMICSLQEKIKLLENTGLDHLVILEFTPEFSELSSHDFVENILAGSLGARIIIVGFNHHFGRHRKGNFEYLYSLAGKHNFTVEEIPEQDIQNESVSSTRIRKAIAGGNIQRANAYLDHFYTISGKAFINEVHTVSYGHPVFDLDIDDKTKLIPPDGIYAVNIHCGFRQTRGMFSITYNAIENNVISDRTELEFIPFGKDEVLQGGEVVISFHKKIREGLVDGNAEEVSRQLKKDIRVVEDLIF